jgi:hypothetical protein
MWWILLLFIGIVLILTIIRPLHALRQIQEPFQTVDQQQPQQQQQTPSPPEPDLKSDPDYQEFYGWHRQFCDVWMKVVSQSMKVDQTTLSQTEYIQKLETAQNKIFVKCSSAITDNPDPTAAAPLIPDKPDIYLATLNYMADRISKILTDTQNALRGEAPSLATDGFENPPPSSSTQQQTCVIPCSPDVLDARRRALQEIRAKVKRFNPSIQTLKGQLRIVETGLRDLEAYKQRAESGEIIKDINIKSD